ncbi:MAG: hypothetical protein WKG00_33935 [Polyangiaceae bacterium]
MSKTPSLALLYFFVAACASTTPPPSGAQSAPAPGEPSPAPDAPPSLDAQSPATSATGLPPRPPLGAPPAGGACTEMGCSGGFAVSLEPSSRWPAGDYRFEIEADGAAQVCEVTLPLRGCAAGPSVKCTGASLGTIGESGCALDPKEHGLSSIQFRGNPLKMKIGISRSGKALVAQELAPAYRWVQPNGAGCAPQCLQASSTIRVAL